MLLYMEERYEEVNDKKAKFNSFPEEIKAVLAEYHNVFDSKLKLSMDVEPSELNVVEGSKSRAYFTCRPTPVHYRLTAEKLVNQTGYPWPSDSPWISHTSTPA